MLYCHKESNAGKTCEGSDEADVGTKGSELEFREGGGKEASPLDSSAPKISCNDVPLELGESRTRFRRELVCHPKGIPRQTSEFAQGEVPSRALGSSLQ